MRKCATSHDDNTSPASDKHQNGSTSRRKSLRPLRFQTQYRFPAYDGGIPHNTAIAFAVPAATPKPSARTTSTTPLSSVVQTDTDMQRTMRRIMDTSVVGAGVRTLRVS